ncbi:MAG: tetratricopeptide repeat protein [Gemmatimonadetes bacterium]|nr:tetratricopeptide repeat protein [Gemmatimonadota bacterium]
MTVAGFWTELKRRKIVQRALLYGIVAWIVIQAADIVIPALNIPEWGVSLVVVLLALGFPVAIVLAWMFDKPSEVLKGQRRPTRPARERRGEEEDAGPRSIAVLPFVNMSDDKENEYFSDGMTEEILNALTKVPDLRVASRTSSFAFKGKVQDVLEIADELRVDTVVEGSVRKVQNRVRVTAQLIDADDGYHLWSETYDRDLEDIFKVQDEIAHSIVDALKLELVGEEKERLVSPETEDVEAYTLYLKGRFFFNRYQETDLRRSLDHYAQALAHDPSYGRAYAGMADTWMQLADDWVAPETAYPEAKTAAEKAIELDDRLAEAHTARGKVLGWFEWDFDGAELALRRAVASNPRYADAHWGLASILPSNGQLDAAIEEARTALSLDPLSGIFSYWLARFLYFARRYDEAREEATRAAELDPTSFRPLLVLGLCHLMEERSEDALASFRRSLEVSGVVSANAFIARALVAAGQTDEAKKLLAAIEAGDDYVRHEFMAPAYAALGDVDRAMAALETAYEERSAGLVYLHVDPSYDVLRGDERYQALVRRIGLKSS